MATGELVLYDLPASPPCRAVKMVAHLIGVKLNIRFVDLMKKKQLEPEFRKLNPFHKVPVLDDNGFILTESNAIIRYLANKYAASSSIYPQDPQKRAVVDQWLSLSSSTFFANGAAVLRYQFFYGKPAPEDIVLKAKECIESLNSILATKNNFLTGDDITLADIALVASLSEFEMGHFDLSPYANVLQYIYRIRTKLSPVYAEINDKAEAELKQIVNDCLKPK